MVISKDIHFERGRLVGAGTANTGNGESSNFYSELLVDGRLAYRWSNDGLKPGQAAIEKIPLDYIISFLSLKPGKHSLTIVVDAGGYIEESDKANNEHSAEFAIITDLPDLKPYALKGWNAPLVLMAGDGAILKSGQPYQKDRSVLFGITNAGTKTAASVSFWLMLDGKAVYMPLEPQLLPGDIRLEKVSLDDLISVEKIRSGKRVLQVIIDPQNSIEELDKSNNIYTIEIEIAAARPPVPRRAPQSPIEAAIQQFFDEYTWITNANIDRVVAIAREVFKEIPVDWSTVKVSALPFAEFNSMYGETFGDTFAEKRRLTETAAASPLTGYSFFNGNSRRQSVVVREGLLVQVLPFILREVGASYYIRKNPRGIERASTVPNQELIVDLSELYGLQILREKYGWEGLTNVSYLVDDGAFSLLSALVNSSELVGTSVRIPWALALDSEHPEGSVPSSTWLKLYLDLVNMSDPSDYVNSVVIRSRLVNRDRTTGVIESRLVDKEPAPIPESVRQKLDPENKYGAGLSFDFLLANQLSFFRP